MSKKSRNFEKILALLDSESPVTHQMDHSEQLGWQDGLYIRIPKSVIDVVVTEAVRCAVKSTYQKQMRDALREMLVSTIFIPLSIIITIFAIATALVLIGVGAWITSIPFVLAAVVGIYYNYLKKRERRQPKENFRSEPS